VSNPRVGTNTSWDFLSLVIDLLQANILRRGDVLVMDNATVHKAIGILGMLLALLAAHNVRLISCRRTARNCRLVNSCSRSPRGTFVSGSFQTEILRSYAGVSLQDLFAYYYQCIHHFDR